MEILQLLFANPGMTLLVVIWVVFGVVAVFRGSSSLFLPTIMTIFYGIYRFFAN